MSISKNILFRWYSSQDALVWLFSYSKVGVYILEFLIRQESKHIICTWLCRRRKIVLENLKSIRNQQFFLPSCIYFTKKSVIFLRSSSGWLYAQDKKLNTIYIYNVACTFVSTLKEHFLHAQSCKLRSYTKEYRCTVEFVNIRDKFQEVYYILHV